MNTGFGTEHAFLKSRSAWWPCLLNDGVFIYSTDQGYIRYPARMLYHAGLSGEGDCVENKLVGGGFGGAMSNQHHAALGVPDQTDSKSKVIQAGKHCHLSKTSSNVDGYHNKM